MNLEIIVLCKVTQEQKIEHHIFSLRWVLNNENTWTQGREHYKLGSIVGNRGGTSMGREIGEG